MKVNILRYGELRRRMFLCLHKNTPREGGAAEERQCCCIYVAINPTIKATYKNRLQRMGFIQRTSVHRWSTSSLYIEIRVS